VAEVRQPSVLAVSALTHYHSPLARQPALIHSLGHCQSLSVSQSVTHSQPHRVVIERYTYYRLRRERWLPLSFNNSVFEGTEVHAYSTMYYEYLEFELGCFGVVLLFEQSR